MTPPNLERKQCYHVSETKDHTCCFVKSDTPLGFLHRWSAPAPTCWLSFQETSALSSRHHSVEWLLCVFQHKSENHSYGDQTPDFRKIHATGLGGGVRDPHWLLQGTLKHSQSYPDLGVSMHTMEKQSSGDQNSLTPLQRQTRVFSHAAELLHS